MTEETENLVLELLRKTRASQERMEQDIADLKTRMTANEMQIGAVGLRLDRMDERLARIEGRLELVNV